MIDLCPKKAKHSSFVNNSGLSKVYSWFLEILLMIEWTISNSNESDKS